MLLEDFYDAKAFRNQGVPDMDDWVDELRDLRAAQSCLNYIP